MKEAAGEANMTVITIVLIAIVLGVGTIVVYGLLNNMGQSSACNSSGAYWRGGKCCTTDSGTCTIVSCTKATANNTTTGVKKGEWTCQSAN